MYTSYVVQEHSDSTIGFSYVYVWNEYFKFSLDGKNFYQIQYSYITYIPTIPIESYTTQFHSLIYHN